MLIAYKFSSKISNDGRRAPTNITCLSKYQEQNIDIRTLFDIILNMSKSHYFTTGKKYEELNFFF